MIAYKGILVSFAILLFNQIILPIQKLPEKLSLTTSIIVPCHSNHAGYLYDLIKSYTMQTVLPQEIVVSLSNTDNIPVEAIIRIENQSWPFKVELMFSRDQRSPAQNRNTACGKASGEIIICQDADDLPHPQRVEIIKYFFENYGISHLLHGMTDKVENFQLFDGFDKMQWMVLENPGLIFDHNLKILHGSPAFRKYVFEKVKYDESIKIGEIGEDIRFSDKVYSFYKNNIILIADICFYNWSASTYHGAFAVGGPFDRSKFHWPR